MSDIGGIFSPLDLWLMALVAGAPGFALCLGAVLFWVLAIK